MPDHLGALRLAAREGAARPVEGEIAELDVDERVERLLQRLKERADTRIVDPPHPGGEVDLDVDPPQVVLPRADHADHLVRAGGVPRAARGHADSLPRRVRRVFRSGARARRAGGRGGRR